MPWIHKRLQINPGSYGILGLDAGNVMEGTGFKLLIYGYVDCGGKHEHNCFTLLLANALKVANTLVEFAGSRQEVREERRRMILEQEHKGRGTLYLNVMSSNALRIGIGTYEGTCASVTLTSKWARKVAGYLFFWAGAEMLGKRSVKVPARRAKVLDINDIVVRYEPFGALEEDDG